MTKKDNDKLVEYFKQYPVPFFAVNDSVKQNAINNLCQALKNEGIKISMLKWKTNPKTGLSYSKSYDKKTGRDYSMIDINNSCANRLALIRYLSKVSEVQIDQKDRQKIGRSFEYAVKISGQIAQVVNGDKDVFQFHPNDIYENKTGSSEIQSTDNKTLRVTFRRQVEQEAIYEIELSQEEYEKLVSGEITKNQLIHKKLGNDYGYSSIGWVETNAETPELDSEIRFWKKTPQ